MKQMKLLVWVTQFALSVVSPIVCSILLCLWLRDSWGWGDWIVPVGIVLGVIMGIDGMRQSLRLLKSMTDQKRKDRPVAFNDHE